MSELVLNLKIDTDNLAEELLSDFNKAEDFIKLLDKNAQDAGFTMRMAQYFTREIVKVYENSGEPVTFDDLLTGESPA